jgi:hypothetical protein
MTSETLLTHARDGRTARSRIGILDAIQGEWFGPVAAVPTTEVKGHGRPGAE